jgi:hypothetical protein
MRKVAYPWLVQWLKKRFGPVDGAAAPPRDVTGVDFATLRAEMVSSEMPPEVRACIGLIRARHMKEQYVQCIMFPLRAGNMSLRDRQRVECFATANISTYRGSDGVVSWTRLAEKVRTTTGIMISDGNLKNMLRKTFAKMSESGALPAPTRDNGHEDRPGRKAKSRRCKAVPAKPQPAAYGAREHEAQSATKHGNISATNREAQRETEHGNRSASEHGNRSASEHRNRSAYEHRNRSASEHGARRETKHDNRSAIEEGGNDDPRQELETYLDWEGFERSAMAYLRTSVPAAVTPGTFEPVDGLTPTSTMRHVDRYLCELLRCCDRPALP